MRAAQVTGLDGPSAVQVVEIDEPRAGGRVLIDVHAAGVSFPEVLQTRGLYQIRPHLPFVPGSEVAGVVREAPDGAAVRSGDRVAAFPGVVASPRSSPRTRTWCSRCLARCRSRSERRSR